MADINLNGWIPLSILDINNPFDIQRDINLTTLNHANNGILSIHLEPVPLEDLIHSLDKQSEVLFEQQEDNTVVYFPLSKPEIKRSRAGKLDLTDIYMFEAKNKKEYTSTQKIINNTLKQTRTLEQQINYARLDMQIELSSALAVDKTSSYIVLIQGPNQTFFSDLPSFEEGTLHFNGFMPMNFHMPNILFDSLNSEEIYDSVGDIILPLKQEYLSQIFFKLINLNKYINES